MTIGIDLDNTIICYDGVFWREAVARNWISASTPPTKEAVKASVVTSRGNESWTHLQGEIYGPLLSQAVVFPGFPEFLRAARSMGHRVEIVSHKSQFPALGPAYDLRKAAISWLERNDLLCPPLLQRGNLHFCDTRDAKVATIRALGCEVFVDDLEEVLEHPSFPESTRRVLFRPEAKSRAAAPWNHLASWTSALQIVVSQATALS